MLRYNPFKPGSIVSPGMFAGRAEELHKLERVLFQTKNGNPSHFILTGERGIGKRSLLFYFESLAAGSVRSLEGMNYNFLVISITLEPRDSYYDVIKKVGAELKRQIDSRENLRRRLDKVWEFITRWEAFGVSYAKADKQPDPSEVLDDLVQTLDETVKALRDHLDGIALLIDEADTPGQDAHLGSLLKSLTEKLSRKGCNQVCVGLAGMPDLLDKLSGDHPSSVRIFDVLHLQPLVEFDGMEVLRRGVNEANQKNAFPVSLDDEAAGMISHFSGGFPHFLQQYAFSAFESDTDNRVASDDVVEGALKPNGAIHQLGLKYFNDLFYRRIYSDDYRKVLRAMAEYYDEWVSKEDIRKKLTISEPALNNALKALRERKIIQIMDGKKGKYRLGTVSFAFWIKSQMMAEKQRDSNGTNGHAKIPGPGSEGH